MLIIIIVIIIIIIIIIVIIIIRLFSCRNSIFIYGDTFYCFFVFF